MLHKLIQPRSAENKLLCLYQYDDIEHTILEYVKPMSLLNLRAIFDYNKNTKTLNFHLNFIYPSSDSVNDYFNALNEVAHLQAKLLGIKNYVISNSKEGVFSIYWQCKEQALHALPILFKKIAKNYADKYVWPTTPFALSIFQNDDATPWLATISDETRKQFIDAFLKMSKEDRLQYLCHTNIHNLKLLIKDKDQLQITENDIIKNVAFLNVEILAWLINDLNIPIQLNSIKSDKICYFDKILLEKLVWQSDAPPLLSLDMACELYHRKGAYSEILHSILAKMDKQKFTAWLYQELQQLHDYPLIYKSDFIMAFKDLLDLNYQVSNQIYTLSELLLLKFPNISDEFILSADIDFSKSTHLTTIALDQVGHNRHQKIELCEALLEKGAPEPKILSLNLVIAATKSQRLNSLIFKMLDQMSPETLTNKMYELAAINHQPLRFQPERDAYNAIYLECLYRYYQKIDFNVRGSVKRGSSILENIIYDYPQSTIIKLIHDLNVNVRDQNSAVIYACENKKWQVAFTIFDKQILSGANMKAEVLNMLADFSLKETQQCLNQVEYKTLKQWFQENSALCNSETPLLR